MARNKIVYNGTTLIDLTGDNITPADVLSGVDFHGRDGEAAVGSMPERGAVAGTIGSKDDEYTIQAGHHNGSGKVGISSTEKAKLIPGNIKNGVTVLGVQGTYTGASPTLETVTKSYTPSASAQTDTITPGSGYDYIEEVDVTIAAIPYVETANAYGTTVEIG